MRFSILVIASRGRREYSNTIKASSEEHARNVVRQWLGDDAAQHAIIRPVTETLMQVVERKEGEHGPR